jgi:ribose transport system substrate-binding protein
MKRSIPLTVLGIVSALSLVACGNSGSSTSATPPSGDASSAGSGGNSVVSTAQAELDKYTSKPTFNAPGPALDAKPLAGKTIAIVAIDQTTPSLQLAAQGVKAAAAALGMKTTLFDAKDNPSDMTAGVEQAIAAHAGAIVLDGIAVQLVTSQLEKAAAAGIPVINADNGTSIAPSPKGIFANATPDFNLSGKLAADAAIVATKGQAKAILVGTEGITPGAELLQGLTDGIKACSTCSIVDTKSVQIQDWFTTLTSTTTSLIQSNPSANVMLPIYVTMAMQMVPGVQQAGAADKIKLFSTSAPPDAAKLLANTPSLGGLVGDSDTEVGWYAVDQALRGMLKMDASTATVPIRYLTPETVKSEGTSEDALYGGDYRDGFTKLWGVS